LVFTQKRRIFAYQFLNFKTSNMELKSNFDFRALRKAQSLKTRDYNRTARAFEKLGLDVNDTKSIEAILTKSFDADMQKIASGIGVNGTGAPAEGLV
jgi:dsDNA-specific endonuclease/ATPase MutS2